MAIAIIAALFSGRVAFSGWFLLIPAIIAGAAAGAYLAGKVEMTAMPQLVAILHSFVGLAAVLVGISAFVHPHGSGHEAHAVNEVAAEMMDSAGPNMPAVPVDAVEGAKQMVQKNGANRSRLCGPCGRHLHRTESSTELPVNNPFKVSVYSCTTGKAQLEKTPTKHLRIRLHHHTTGFHAICRAWSHARQLTMHSSSRATLNTFS